MTKIKKQDGGGFVLHCGDYELGWFPNRRDAYHAKKEHEDRCHPTSPERTPTVKPAAM